MDPKTGRSKRQHSLSNWLFSRICPIAMTISVMCNFIIIHFYLFERQGEKECSHLLVYSQNAGNSQGWTRMKAGARNSILVSYVLGRNSVT